MSTVGNNIAILRKELGLTQEELAKKMGYKSKSTINKIELGINDIPQSKVVKFAEILNTTPEFLMGWEDKKTPPSIELDEDEKLMLDLFKCVPEEKKALVIAMIRAALNNQ